MINENDPQKVYNHRVVCFTDKSLSVDFEHMKDAVEHVNELLAQGHKAKIYPWSPRKKYIDYIAENEEQFRKKQIRRRPRR